MKLCAECNTQSDDAAPWCASCGGASWAGVPVASVPADAPTTDGDAAKGDEASSVEPAPSKRKGGR